MNQAHRGSVWESAAFLWNKSHLLHQKGVKRSYASVWPPGVSQSSPSLTGGSDALTFNDARLSAAVHMPTLYLRSAHTFGNVKRLVFFPLHMLHGAMKPRDPQHESPSSADVLWTTRADKNQ